MRKTKRESTIISFCSLKVSDFEPQKIIKSTTKEERVDLLKLNRFIHKFLTYIGYSANINARHMLQEKVDTLSIQSCVKQIKSLIARKIPGFKSNKSFFSAILIKSSSNTRVKINIPVTIGDILNVIQAFLKSLYYLFINL